MAKSRNPFIDVSDLTEMRIVKKLKKAHCKVGEQIEFITNTQR